MYSYMRSVTVCFLLYVTNARLLRETIEDIVPASRENARNTNTDCLHFDADPIRNPRHTNEKAAKYNVTQPKRPSESKIALVKKPIPKFTDTGSEEDYQAKLLVSNKASDTVEHEDEDFSIDDYDFDVNHDEYAGRGKPLEPRVKVKVSKPRKPTDAPAKVERPPAAMMSQSKGRVPQSEDKPSNKVPRKAATGVMKEDEYDEEFSAITKSPEKQRKAVTGSDVSSFSEEIEESKEEEMKRTMRFTRSSSPFSFAAYVDKLGVKTSEFVTKMLSYLPLFPQKYYSLEKVNDHTTAENAPISGPSLDSSIPD